MITYIIIKKNQKHITFATQHKEECDNEINKQEENKITKEYVENMNIKLCDEIDQLNTNISIMATLKLPRASSPKYLNHRQSVN